jgi:hypothetical protein
VDNEYWIYVNGISTTKSIAESNIKLLQIILRRPIYLCHNPTSSIINDLLECLAGKIGFFRWFWVPAPNAILTTALDEALTEANKGTYTRVVLIAHSQGSIITANALQDLSKRLGRNGLMLTYLEVFVFANCSNYMPGTNVKYLENISNRCDTVVWLGALFPFPNFWIDTHLRPMNIGGTRVTEPIHGHRRYKFWGHLLNTHYLHNFENGEYPGSVLHSYRNGGRRIIAVSTMATRG